MSNSLVYFIGYDGGPIKIGHSVNPTARLVDLQMGSHEDLRILATMPGGLRKERELHRRFAAHRLRGEWFSPVEEVLEFVREVNGGRIDGECVQWRPTPLMELITEESRKVNAWGGRPSPGLAANARAAARARLVAAEKPPAPKVKKPTAPPPPVARLRFLRVREVLHRTGMSRSLLYATPNFPNAVKIGPRAVAWVEAEVEQWIDERMAAREAA